MSSTLSHGTYRFGRTLARLRSARGSFAERYLQRAVPPPEGPTEISDGRKPASANLFYLVRESLAAVEIDRTASHERDVFDEQCSDQLRNILGLSGTTGRNSFRQ